MEASAGLVEIRTITTARPDDESGCGRKAWELYFKELEDHGARRTKITITKKEEGAVSRTTGSPRVSSPANPQKGEQLDFSRALVA